MLRIFVVQTFVVNCYFFQVLQSLQSFPEDEIVFAKAHAVHSFPLYWDEKGTSVWL
jgi:hypothetical protein